jgi:hypothetical protein
MEVQLLNKRLSTPRAVTVIALAATVSATAVAVPSFAGQVGSFLTNRKAAHLYLTDKKASGLFLRKKAAGNLFVKKAGAPLTPIVGIAAGTAVYGPSSATTAGYIPTAFTSFATHAEVNSVVLTFFATKGVAPAVITFSGNATCTAATPTADLACPIQILVDGQSTGKVNFAPATVSSPSPVPLVYTVMQTTVLQKGGHTVAIQYAGAKSVTFTLKSWNLSVQAYPETPEPAETPAK